MRTQDGGASLYVGIYFWNNGDPNLMLFKRVNGNWGQLGTVSTNPLAAGTVLKLTVVGQTLAFVVNGVVKLSATYSRLTGGAPGIEANGVATAADWVGGNSSFEMDYSSTDARGIQYYSSVSANNGYGAQVVRVLTPTHPAAGVAHNFLIVLPVEAGLGSANGDGLLTLQSLDAEDQYNLTIIEPTFDIEPWYANDPSDPNLQYETSMTDELVPWIKANLATTGNEQIWLIGYSKSGLGAQDLILKYPRLFTLAASWDFPADMSTYDEFTTSAANYGTQANFAANYQLTPSFVSGYSGPFLTSNRIWIGGYNLYQADVTDYNTLLNSLGIEHGYSMTGYDAHRWDSGWMPVALAALYQDSINLPPGS